MTIETSMYPWISAILVLYIVFALVRGWQKGVILRLLDLASMVASMLIGWGGSYLISEYLPLAAPFSRYAGLSSWQVQAISRLFWFVLLFILLKIVFGLLYRAARWVRKLPVISLADHVGGLLVSCMTTWIVLMIVSLCLQLPIFKNGTDYVHHSFLNGVNMISMEVWNGLVDGDLDFEQIQEIVFPK